MSKPSLTLDTGGGDAVGPRGEMRRRLLLEAALELFGEHGYDGATTRSIAERAGVTEAALFKYFPTKHDLFLAVLAEFGPRGLFRMPTAEAARKPLAAALELLVTSYLDTFFAHRRWLHVLFHESQRDPAAAEELREQHQAVGQILHDVLAERAERGEVVPELSQTGAEVIGLAMRGFIMRTCRQTPEDWHSARESFVRGLVAVVTRGIAARTPARSAKRVAPSTL